MKRKDQNNPCKGCVWMVPVTEKKIFCPFPRCVKKVKLPVKRGKEQG